MADELSFTLTLERIQGYEFRLRFDWPDVPDLLLDEPAPLGAARGPNASRLLAGAVANCLSASLLFCLQKSRVETPGLKTAVTGALARNAKGRLRIERLDVTIALESDPQQAAQLSRCIALFEDYCVVTQSVRRGIPVHVKVTDGAGQVLFQD